MRRFSILLLMILLSEGVAQAATYYVSKSGSNGNSCTQAQSLSTPKLTVVAGIACMAGGGDTLLVRSGDYNEAIASTPTGTSWTNKVRIANYPGETVWLRPLSNANSAGGIGEVIWLDANVSYVEFDGINLDGSNVTGGVFWLSTNNGNDPHHIRFKNAEVIAGAIGSGGAIDLGAHTAIGAIGSNEILNVRIHGGGLPGSCGYQCASYGIYIKGPNNLIDGVDIYDTSGAGIQIYNADGDAPDNNIIRNTRIHDITRAGSPNQVWGIIVAGNNNQIYNNLIYRIDVGDPNPGNAGITIGNGTSGNKIWNNTLYSVRNTGIYIGSGASSTEIKNNIVYASSGANLFDGGTGTVQSTNLLGVDPLFVNAGTGDFALTSGSPARNKGTTIGAVTTDTIGTPRPQEGTPDIGAYELRTSPSGPPLTPTLFRIVP